MTLISIIESKKIQVGGFICKNVCPYPSNHRKGNQTLSEYLADNNIPGIYDIDTRKLVRILRDSGAMRGVVLTGDISPEEAVNKKKIKLLIAAANEYVIKNDLDVEVRFDIISIHKKGDNYNLNHIKEAFLFF